MSGLGRSHEWFDFGSTHSSAEHGALQRHNQPGTWRRPMSALRAGRDCPLDYRLAASAFQGPVLFDCDSLYVVGGLYGNRQALDALDRLLADEPAARVVFNGDLHWFDREPQLFAEIERRSAAHSRLRGNVETELARTYDLGAGCGCAYPDSIDEQTVAWSNQIHQALAQTLVDLPQLRTQLAQRPACGVVTVAGQRVAISHGDETSLAGWQCSRQALSHPQRQQALSAWLREQDVQVFASSHTCAPAALQLPAGVLINNGAAGMPNFAGSACGLISRIASTPHESALYRCQYAGLWVEALPLGYAQDAFMSDFDRQWPPASAAALSYRERLLKGPVGTVAEALLGGFQQCGLPFPVSMDYS